jgi:hypothetical protein
MCTIPPSSLGTVLIGSSHNLPGLSDLGFRIESLGFESKNSASKV